MTVPAPAEAPADGVTFVAYHGLEVAFLGVHPVGAVRLRSGYTPLGAELISILPGDAGQWRGARSLEDARARLRAHIARWYDAAHTPLADGQGQRLAAAVQGLPA